MDIVGRQGRKKLLNSDFILAGPEVGWRLCPTMNDISGGALFLVGALNCNKDKQHVLRQENLSFRAEPKCRSLPRRPAFVPRAKVRKPRD
ncbi:hypothetical protein [Bradyrhizobium yuanmingense]|uniref:hypothetical protein n=1 Tax=Bradyrhizobium yuanmingense TaxID=108015 RepID=UPI0023B9DBBA|nr:hypothetical protein [Bradyrhizobium yuanmingense]MDF0582038.1 hypothetical protein [Bradyrhizobium yuanmingense]